MESGLDAFLSATFLGGTFITSIETILSPNTYAMEITTESRSEKPVVENGSSENGSSFKIKVLFFARAREITGLSEMPLSVSSGTTTKECLNKLVAKFPGLIELHNCIVLALNEEYTTESAVVKENDELAIIPPISGG